MRRLAIPALLAILTAVSMAPARVSGQAVRLAPGMVVSKTTRIPAGTYTLRSVDIQHPAFVIRGSNLTVDFTGVTCSNCKANERDVFPKYRKLLEQYALVQMYTDVVPAEFYTVKPGLAERNAEAKEGNWASPLKRYGQ